MQVRAILYFQVTEQMFGCLGPLVSTAIS